jgi:2-methylcitrate dehydratase PrpD
MTNPVVAYGRWLADTPRTWPEAALASAHRQVIDVIAVAIPGAGEPATRRVLDTVVGWGDGPATVIGGGARLAAPWAALVNGTAAHALDFDDNFDPAKAHATAVLAPAILALGEQEGASGADCLDAYVAGLQIFGRTGQGVNPTHRNRGWHATATIGAIGAAAACARLLRLDAARAAHALSVATSMAGGFMSQFGTMAKPLHAGLAAKAGVIAASLARTGLTAGLGTFDSETGMNRLMVGPDYEHLRDSLTHIEHGQTLRFETAEIGEPLLILSSGFRVKRFPNCGSAHRAMDGLLALRDEHGFCADEVVAIDVRAPVSHLNNLMYTAPADPLQAKFSLEYGLACVLLSGRCTLADFTPERVHRPEVLALYPRMHRHPVDAAEGEFPTEVIVTLRGGEALKMEVAMPCGSLAAPFSTAEYWAKFEDCASPVMSEEAKREAILALNDLPILPKVTALMSSLGGPFAEQHHRAHLADGERS